MSYDGSPRITVLFFLFGVALLSAALAIGGPETSVSYQYTAYEVEVTGDVVNMTNLQTGESVRGPGGYNIDEELVCLNRADRACEVTYEEYEGNRTVNENHQYEYAYLDGEFYEISKGFNTPREETYTEVRASAAIDELAIPAQQTSPEAQAGIRQGRVLTNHRLPNANQLLEHDGRYYTLIATAWRTSSTCSSSGIDETVCGDLRLNRWRSWLYPAGIGVLGLFALGIAGRDVLRDRTEICRRARGLQRKVVAFRRG